MFAGVLAAAPHRSPGAARWAATGLAVAALVLACAALTSTCRWIASSAWSGPAVDSWQVVALQAERAHGEPWLPRLVANHAGHRPVVSRGLHLIDAAAFDGGGDLLRWTSLLAQLLLLLLVTRALIRAEVAACAIGCAWALLFSATQAENFVRPWNVHWFTATSSAAVAMAALLRASPAAPRSQAVPWLLLAVSAAALATGSMANGLLVWPLLLALARARGFAGAPTAALAGAGVLAVGVFLLGWNPGSGVDPSELSARLLDRAVWVARCVAAPLSWRDPILGAWLGGALLVAAGVAAWSAFRRGRAASRAELLLAGLMSFAVGTCAMATLGRLGLDAESWRAPRYQTVALLFQATLLGAGFLRAGAAERPRALLLGAAGVLWLVLVVAPAHLREGDRVARLGEATREALLAIRVGVHEREAYAPVLRLADRASGSDSAERLRAYLRNAELAPFDGPALGYRGRPVSELPRGDACPGSVTEMRLLGDPARSIRLAGAVDAGAESPPLLLVTETAGFVVGFGEPVRAGREAFVAFARVAAPPFEGELWGVGRGGAACRIGSWRADGA